MRQRTRFRLLYGKAFPLDVPTKAANAKESRGSVTDALYSMETSPASRRAILMPSLLPRSGLSRSVAQRNLFSDGVLKEGPPWGGGGRQNTERVTILKMFMGISDHLVLVVLI